MIGRDKKAINIEDKIDDTKRNIPSNNAKEVGYSIILASKKIAPVLEAVTTSPAKIAKVKNNNLLSSNLIPFFKKNSYERPNTNALRTGGIIHIGVVIVKPYVLVN